LVLAVSVPFAPVIARAFNSPELAHYWWMMPVYVLLTGGWNVLNYWYIRRKAYGRISGYQISQSLFSAGFKTGFGFMPLNGGLLYATVLSPLCSLALSVSLAAKSHLRALRGWDWSACRTAAKTYANFPKYSTPRALLNNVIGQLPVLVLTPLFGMRLVGFWGMALMLAFVPVSTVTRALYQVMYAWATEQVNARKRMLPFYRSFTLWTLVILLPLLAALWFVLPAFTAWLLGNEWSTTGEYIRWMLPWVLCSVLCSSTGYMTDIFFQQKKGLYFEIALALARVAGVGLGIACNNFTVAIAGYSIGSALVNGVQYGWFISLVRTYEKTISPNG
jgi:O-antigen/teichoic acid export membrane protein